MEGKNSIRLKIFGQLFIIGALLSILAILIPKDSYADETKAVVAEIPQLSWLHTDGKWIKDSQGNVVILHGICFETYSMLNGIQNGKYADHTEEDYKKIAGFGFNVVRLGIAWEYIEPTEGTYDEVYFRLVDRDIEWARKYGIHIIFQFSQWGWSPYFNNVKKGAFGFPSWLFTGYDSSLEGRTRSQKDFLQGKGPNGTEASGNNPSMQERMIKVWKYIAARYKNNPTILGYDLFNEPPGAELGPDTASNYLYAFYERLIDNITPIDNNHLFVYEPVGGRWDCAPRLLKRPNIIFSAHIYPDHNNATKLSSMGFGYSGDKAILENQLLGYFNLPQSNPSKNWNIPILMGEFGESPKSFYRNRYLWTNDMEDIYDKYSIPWIAYGYCVLDRPGHSGGELTIVNRDRSEVKEKADALDKPYPRVSSIPPSEYSFDRTSGRFQVVFNGSGNIKTEIYIPSRYYPNGFEVKNTSRQWSKSWDERNRLLTVDAVLQGSVEITINRTGVSSSTAAPSNLNQNSAPELGGYRPLRKLMQKIKNRQ